MLFKREYTIADLQEIAQWFNERHDKLPQEIDLVPGVHLSNVTNFVEGMIEVSEIHGTNVTFSGNYHMLFQLRERLKATFGEDF